MKPLFALVLVTVTALPGLARADSDFVRTFQERITRLEVRNGAGKVHVRAGGTTTVKASKRDCTAHDVLDVRVSGSTLFVALSRERTWGGSECEVDFDLSIPAAASAEVEVGSGNVRLEGLLGGVRVKSGSGDVTIDGRPTEVTARLGSGDLEARGLTGSAHLTLGSGNVRLAYDVVPPSGALEVKTGSGDIALTLPADARFQLGFRSGAGRVNSGLRATPGAGFVVEVKTGAGDLTIYAHP